ncbi:hypothetical protein L1049_024170 [Liquidambar formosana]|uniref:Uncharacterized protein n=1 Tax=Liquidambar formosana TaxID=63359 RepID=A0AAP0RU15_LIQFO
MLNCPLERQNAAFMFSSVWHGAAFCAFCPVVVLCPRLSFAGSTVPCVFCQRRFHPALTCLYWRDGSTVVIRTPLELSAKSDLLLRLDGSFFQLIFWGFSLDKWLGGMLDIGGPLCAGLALQRYNSTVIYLLRGCSLGVG